MNSEIKGEFFTSFSLENKVDFPKKARIFITGATGFVGSRLIEILINNFEAEVFALVRNYGKAVRLSRYPINYIWGNLNDDSWFENVPNDIDYIIHCAYGNKGNLHTRKQTDIGGSANVLKLSKERNIKRVVFLSTQSVYAVLSDGIINENSSRKPFDEYGKNKLNAEKVFNDLGNKENIPFVIIQPSAVIGPGAPSFVLRPAREIKNFTVCFLNDGKGILNWIYIDDLVCAILQCCVNENVIGETFILSSDSPLTYFDYYSRLSECFGLSFLYKKITKKENEEILTANRIKPSDIIKESISFNKKKARGLLNYSFVRLIYKTAKLVMPPGNMQHSISVVKNSYTSKPFLPIEKNYMDFFSSKAIINSSHAKKTFGYSPFFNVDKALERIAFWYRWKFRYEK